MKCFLSFFLMVIFCGAYGQAVECPKLVVSTDAGIIIPSGGTDTLPCGPSCVTMNAAIVPNNIQGTITYSVTAIAYAPESFTAGSNVTYLGAVMATSGLTDDEFGDVIALPFNFCFFGTSYNQIVVGSNGNATFNTSLANAYDPWPISLPGGVPANNCDATYDCIMAPWNDLEDFAEPGCTVTYNVYGVAPCRQFVVSWNNDQLYYPGLCPGQTSTQQFVLYEGSNIIDVYIQHRAPCTSWNNGYAVTGIENAAGASYYTSPGENGTTFTATDLGWRFSPSAPITWTYAWMDSTGATIGSSDSVSLCPPVTSRYSVSVTSSAPCPQTFTSDFTIIKKSGIGIEDTGSTNPSYCKNTGSIFFHGIPTGDSVMASYIYNGVTVGPSLIFPDVDSTITFSRLAGGAYDTFLFVDKGCTYGPYSLTLTPHPMSAGITVNSDTVCIGTAIAFTGHTTNIDEPTYTWNFNDGSSVVAYPASDSALYHTYPVGGVFTATLSVTDTFGCDSTTTNIADVVNITVHTGVHDTSVCLVDSMPLIAYGQINFPYFDWNYSWTPVNNIGQDSTYITPGAESTTSITNFFGIGTFTYLVTVTTTSPSLVLNPNGCPYSDTETIISYPPVTLTNVTASPQTVNVGSSISLNASGAVYYTWNPDNGTLNNANINNPVATPVDSTTIYTVYGMNDFGCRDSATVIVRVNNTTYQGAPSAFTPNGDGLNDFFKITPLKYQKLVEMRIYNRWGQAVYYTNNPETGWDGTYNGVPQDMGVYSYEIIVSLPGGGDNQVYKGTVTLIR